MKNKTQELTDSQDSEHIGRVYSARERGININDIDTDALKVLSRLHRFGYRAFLVGGSVRDLLLRKQPKDYDIATNATPRKVRELFRNSHIIGRRFRLVHVIFRGQKIIEVSTFRDISSPTEADDSSADEIVPNQTDNIYGDEKTDAIRRDISINALFFDPSSMKILDYVGGMEDIQNSLVRVIGNPDVRFAEDPVRLIRVVRHAVRSDFKIEAECWESLLRNASLIQKSSSVRVYEEIKKDLFSGHSADIFNLLAESNVLPHIFPSLCANESILLNKGGALYTFLDRVDRKFQEGCPPSIVTIFAAMAFFTKLPQSHSLDWLERFEDEANMRDHLLKCFHGVAIPRKEREKVDGVLSLWLALAKGSKRFFMRRNYEERQNLGELLQLIESPLYEAFCEKVESDRPLRRARPRRGRRR